jgi:hypothetical protein
MLVALFLDKPMFHPKIAPQTLPQIVFGSCRTLIQYHNSCVAIPCSTKLHRSINTSPCINIWMNIYIYVYLYTNHYIIYIYTHTSKSKLISLPNPDFSSLFTCIIYKKQVDSLLLLDFSLDKNASKNIFDVRGSVGHALPWTATISQPPLYGLVRGETRLNPQYHVNQSVQSLIYHLV